MFDRKLGGRSKSTQLVEMRCQYLVMHFNAVNDIFRLCGRIVALVKGFFSVGAGRQKIAHMHLIYPPFFLSYNSFHLHVIFMRLPHISHVAASFAHLSKVCILHICIFFCIKWHF